MTRTFAGICSVTCFCLLVLSLLCLEDFRSHLKSRPSKAYNHPSEREVGISRTVSVPSAVRCTRINLPRRYYNSTSAPYNPGAVRHPRSGEWLLVFTYDEVHSPGRKHFALWAPSKRLPMPAARLCCACSSAFPLYWQ